MTAKNGFTSAEKKAWQAYDQTNSDPMDDGEIKTFEELQADTVPHEWGKYGDYRLVGNGEVTDPLKCGKFFGFYGCLNTHLHNKVTLDGVNHKGKVYVKKIFHSCDKPTCPVCFKRGWAVREAASIESRLAECSKKFGLAEHVICSVPKTDYGLTFEKLKAKAIKVLASRGVHGGVLIFHAFRYRNREEAYWKNESMGWYWSPHFHCLGYVQGGYGRCRHCSKNTLECLSCSGFEGVTRREFEKENKRCAGSGYIVKVKGERKTIFGTAWYQLNHSSFKAGAKKFTIATWFGTCSYHKLKIKKGDKLKRDVCPICQHELEKLHYVGSRPFAKYMAEFWISEYEEDLLDAGGSPNWILAPQR
jgi:hypothetical protein